MKALLFLFIVLALASCQTRPPAPVALLDSPAGSASLLGTSYKVNPAEPISAPNQGAYFSDQILSRLPETPVAADKNYLGDNWLAQFDFSGLSLERRRQCTLISPRHVIMAKHYQRAIGDTIKFRDPAGVVHSRTLVGKISEPDTPATPDYYYSNSDGTVGILDSPLPESVKYYKLLPAGYAWDDILKGSLALATDQQGKALVNAIVGITAYKNIPANVDRHRVAMVQGRYYTAQTYNVPSVLCEQLISGDSSSPTFLVYEGELVVIGTHWTVFSDHGFTANAWLLNAASELTNRFPAQ